MKKSHSLKADNKPILFSFDIETEHKSIERWVFDNKGHSKRDLETEANLLRKIAQDYIEVIETKILTDKHLDNLINTIETGASGVWEPATEKLQLLSFHFDNAKLRLIEHLKTGSSKTVERLLTCVSSNFTTSDLMELFTLTFNCKSKKIRIKTANLALDLRNKELIPLLKNELIKQPDNEVKKAIQFAIDNIWQPKGQITF